VEETSNSEQEVTDEQQNDDRLAADDNEEQTGSASLTQSQATRDALQEKLKDMMNVAHVSHLCWLEMEIFSVSVMGLAIV